MEAMDLIKGKRLTAWSVTQDGEYVQLGFVDETDETVTLLLPIGMLSGLMMTIPRMLRDALKAKFSDNSLRMIHKLGDWRVERATGTNGSILSLATPDGFEVTFAVATPQADRLGRTLRHAATPATTESTFLN
jgi:hypothetical protein